jgi:hypothetical protein
LDWCERLISRSEYDGYISNTHGLRISVEDLNGRIIEWEAYCRQTGKDSELSRVSPRLYVEGTLVEVSLHDSATETPSAEEAVQCQHLRWRAVIRRQDMTLSSANFSLTREVDEVKESSYGRLKALKWAGLILGRKYGTYYSGNLKRSHNPGSSGMVLTVLDMSSGVAERLGLAVFEHDVGADFIPSQIQSAVLC